MKVLIYIVCYNAEKHIRKVLERMPIEYRDNQDVKVLISDDCSTDQTASQALKACGELGYANYEVIRTRVNQGYGGNQKLGYQYACGNGFEYVILLHGDGQYAPEELPHFFRLFPSAPDVILGSRMLNKKNALMGGMPFYKFVSNILLTKAQNLLARTGLSEFHTGYRAYSTAFLREVPYELNSNGFDFDTDILLQAVFAGKSIQEFPIMTFYGDETCHVNVMRYGMDILRTSVKFRMQQLGIGSSLKFRGSKAALYKDKFGYKFSSHYHLLKVIDAYQPKRILEIGSGDGFLGAAIKERHIDLAGIDLVPPQNGHYSRFYREDAERFDFARLEGKSFDMVCLMDVLEHLREPETLLLRLRKNASFENAVFVVSVPNIAFFTIRIGLLFGRFNYADRGILDIDHKRLFTSRSLRTMLRECGYTVQKIIPITPPFHLLNKHVFADFLSGLFNMLNKALPGLFSFQTVAVAVPIPAPSITDGRLVEKYK